MIRSLLILLMFAVACGAAEPTITLQRGVNLSHWYSQANRYRHDHGEHYLTAADFALIRSVGLDHVRFPVDPEPILDFDAETGQLNADHVTALDRAIGLMLEADLKVIVDMQPSDGFKQRVRDDETYAKKFERFWSLYAKHLSRYDPSRVALEIMNEPDMPADRWQQVAERVHTAMRTAAPKHTIIVTGPQWGNIEMLTKLTPLDDPNTLYTFHYYNPMDFTHQQATWGAAYWKALRDVPWPMTPRTVEPVLDKQQSDEARRNLKWNARNGWDAAAVQQQVDQAAAWAKQHGISLWCGEFGTFRKAPPEARARWLRDVRTALEKRNIPWAMWDYNDAFGLVEGRYDEPRRVDPVTADALGLKHE